MGSHPARQSFRKRHAPSLGLRALVLGLSWTLAVFPLSGSWATSAFASDAAQTKDPKATKDSKATQVQPNQQQAQQNTKSNNEKGSGLAQVLSILTMAMGGISMYKGIQDLSTCSASMGTAAGMSNGGLEEGAAVASQQSITTGLATQLMQTGVPSAQLYCPKIPARLPLFQFVFPQTSEAGNACMDGALATGMGALMLIQGIMGMQGAKAAANNANVAGTNAVGLSSLNSSDIGGDLANDSQGIKIDPSLLRNGKADSIMGEFEKKFGISRDDFANAVANGADPREILKAAPMNAIPGEIMANASNAAGSFSPENQAKLMAKSDAAALQKEMLAENGYEMPVGSGGRSTAGLNSGGTELMPLSDLMGQGELKGADPMTAGLQLSPEVQSALEQQANLDQLNGKTDITIFQMVRNKYKEKYGMIHGNVGGGGLNGIAGADGYGH